MGCCFEVGELELSRTVLSLAGFLMPPGSATETFRLFALNLVVCSVFLFRRPAFGGCARMIHDCDAEHSAVQAERKQL